MAVPFPAPGTTILVVDDERITRRVAYRILSEEGYRVFEAASADEAMSVLDMAHQYIHLVVLDVVMPVVDGFWRSGRRFGCSICRPIRHRSSLSMAFETSTCGFWPSRLPTGNCWRRLQRRSIAGAPPARRGARKRWPIPAERETIP